MCTNTRFVAESPRNTRRGAPPHLRNTADWTHCTRGTPASAVLAVSRQEILWIQPRGLRLHSPTRGRTVCAEPRQRVVRSVEASFHTIRPNRWTGRAG